MPTTSNFLYEFADATQEHDLAAEILDDARVRVHNTISPRLVETVTCTDDGYFQTSWGYILGTVHDITGAAARLGFLLAALRPDTQR